MDVDSGMHFISQVQFRLNVISHSYDKIAALRIEEITSNSVIKELQHAMFLFQRIQSKLKLLEHVSMSAPQRVTISQASLMLEKLNEVNRLTKIYRAVRILRNERSQFGKYLSPEGRKWADRYLELCRNRGLNLVRRKYAAQLLEKINETISVYRLLTVANTSWANMNIADPTNFTFDEFNGMDPTIVQKKIEKMFNKNYPQDEDLLRKLILLRDTFSKLLGFENYIDFSLQSQLFTREKVHSMLFGLLGRLSPHWKEKHDLCLEKKKVHCEKHGILYEKDFSYKDLTYFFRLLPALDYLIMNLFFPFKKTVEKTLELFGFYFGLAFKLKEYSNDCLTYYAWDSDTNHLLGTVVMQLFTAKSKPGMKTTVAFHEAEKGFCSEFLANLDDEFKADSRFEEFQRDSSSPLICHIVTDIKHKYGKSLSESALGRNDSFDSEEDPHSTPTEINDDSEIPCQGCINSQRQSEDNKLMLTLFDILHICHELGYVLQHLFGQATSQIFRTCCSEKDFVHIPSVILQHLIIEPENLKRISSDDFTHRDMSDEEAIQFVNWYKWEETFKVMCLLQNGYLDLLSHINLKDDPKSLINYFATNYLLIKKDEKFLCPDLLLSLTEQKTGQHYSKAWAYHAAKLIFGATFKARGLDRQVGRDFRRFILEPDLNVDFRVRLRNFLGEDTNSESILEKCSRWFCEKSH